MGGFLKDFGAWVAVGIALLTGAVGYGVLNATQAADHADLQTIKPQVQKNTTDSAVLQQAVGDMQKSLDRIEGALGTKR